MTKTKMVSLPAMNSVGIVDVNSILQVVSADAENLRVKNAVNSPAKHDEQQGFTLIEMMLVVALIATLSMVVSPSLSAFFQRNKLTSEVNQFSSHLQLAKSIAASQFTYVMTCPTQDRINCTGNWQDEIITFTDQNNNGFVDSTDKILSSYKVSLPVKVYANRDEVRFAPINTTMTTTATIALCINEQVKQALVISNVGRIRLELDKDKVNCD
ncbi:GspH/FimT family pseudopilin [Psychrosphaera saromensis]|nr:GspH/FimT family pseudopilin [Psychrosphaera saromensis]